MIRGKSRKLILLLFILSVTRLWADSLIPSEPDQFLGVTDLPQNGDHDGYAVIFFEIPDSYDPNKLIYFGIYDPDCDSGGVADGQIDMDGTDDAYFELYGGVNTYSDPNSRSHTVSYPPPGNQLVPQMTIPYNAGDIYDDNWVYFDPVTKGQGELIGDKRVFKILAYTSGTSGFKNGFKAVMASDDSVTTGQANASDIPESASYMFTWSLLWKDTAPADWTLYPYLPNGMSTSGKGDLILNVIDLDRTFPNTVTAVYRDYGDTATRAALADGVFAGNDQESNYTLDVSAADERTTLQFQVNNSGVDADCLAEFWFWRAADGTVADAVGAIGAVSRPPSMVDMIKAYSSPQDLSGISPGYVSINVGDGEEFSGTAPAGQLITLQVMDDTATPSALPYETTVTVTLSDGANPTTNSARIEGDNNTYFNILPDTTDAVTKVIRTDSTGFASFVIHDTEAETVTITLNSGLAQTNFTDESGTVDFVTDVQPVIDVASTDSFDAGTAPTGTLSTYTISDTGAINVGLGAPAIRIRPGTGLDVLFDTGSTLTFNGGTYGGTVTLGSITASLITLNLSADLPIGATLNINQLDLTAINTASSGYLEFSFNGGPWISAERPIIVIGYPTATWDDGAGDELWNSPANWDNNVVPGSGTDVTIPAGFTVTVPAGLNPTVSSLTMGNSTLDLSDNNFTVTGDLDSTGTIRLNGAAAQTFGYGTLTAIGNMEYYDSDNSAANSYNILDLPYANLTINDSDAGFSTTWTPLANLVITGNLNLSTAQTILDSRGRNLTIGGTNNNAGNIILNSTETVSALDTADGTVTYNNGGGGGALDFAGYYNLVINDTGTFTAAGALSINGDATFGGNLTTAGNLTITGNVIITGDSTWNTGGNDITTGGTVDTNADNSYVLTLNSGAGAISLGGALGSTAFTDLDQLSIITSNTAALTLPIIRANTSITINSTGGGSITSTAVLTTGTLTADTMGALINLTGSSLAGIIDLDSTNGVGIGANITYTTGQDLLVQAINAGGGNVLLDANNGTGYEINDHAVDAVLDITADGLTLLNDPGQLLTSLELSVNTLTLGEWSFPTGSAVLINDKALTLAMPGGWSNLSFLNIETTAGDLTLPAGTNIAVINSAYIRLISAGAGTLTTTGNLSVADGDITLQSGGNIQIDHVLTSSGTGDISLKASLTLVDGAGGYLTFDGTGAVNLDIEGSQTLDNGSNSIPIVNVLDPDTDDSGALTLVSAAAVQLSVTNALAGLDVDADLTMASAADINGDLTLRSTNDFNDGGFTHTVAGDTDFTGTNAGTWALTGTFTFDGTTDLTSAGISFNNLIVNGTSVTLQDPLDVNGDLTITAGTLDVGTGPFQINLAGDWVNNGTFTESTGLVVFDNGGAQSINSGGTTAAKNFYQIQKSGSGVLSLLTNSLVVTNQITVDTWTTLDIANFNLTGGSTVINNGTFILNGSQTITVGSYSDSGTTEYTGTGAAFSISGAGDLGASYNNLTFSGADPQITFPASMTLSGDLDVSTVTGTLLNTDTNNTVFNFNGTTTYFAPAVSRNFVLHSLNITGTLALDATQGDLTLRGDWTQGGTFTHNSQAVEFVDGSVTSTILGTTTFFDLTVDAADGGAADPEEGKILLLDHLNPTTVANTFIFRANASGDGNLIYLDSDDGTNPADLDVLTASQGNIEFAVIRNSNSANSLTVDDCADGGGNNGNWNFNFKTVTWDGSQNTDWADGRNWDWGYAPSPVDDVIIDGSDAPALPPNMPTVDQDRVTNDLTIEVGATVTTGTNDLTVNGNYTLAGTLIRRRVADSNIPVTGTITDSGLTRYIGTGGVIQEYAATDYNDLQINSAGQTFTLGADLRVANDLNITAGELDTTVANRALQVDNDITIAGTLTANGSTLTIAADWSNTGTFNANASTVVFTGAGDIASGGDSFNNADSTGGARTTTGAFSAATLDITGGTLTADVDTLNITGAMTLSGGDFTQSGGGTLTADSITINNAASTLTGNQPVTVDSGDFAISAGTYTGSSTLDITGTNNLSVTGSGSFTPGGAVSVSGTSGFNSSGTITTGSTFTSTALITIAGGSVGFGNVAGSTDLVTASGGLTVNGGTLSWNNGGFGLADLDINGAVSLTSGTLEAGNRTIEVFGNWTESAAVLDVTGGTSTVDFDGTATQTVDVTGRFDNMTASGTDVQLGSAVNLFNGLTVSGSLDTMATFDMDIDGSVSISGTGVFRLRDSSLTVGVDWTTAGTATLTADTSDVTFDTAASQITSNSDAFYDVDFSANGSTMDGFTAQNLTVSGGTLTTDSVTIDVVDHLQLTGGIYTQSTGGDTTAGRVTISSGTSTLTANRPLTLDTGDLTISNSTATGLNGTGAIDVEGDVVLSGGTLLGDGRTINVAGSWNNTGGTFDGESSSVVIFDGNSSANIESGGIAAANQFFDLTLAKTLNTNRMTLLNDNILVNNDLAINTGILDTGANLDITVINDIANGANGTIDASGTTSTITVDADWDNAGTFTAGNSTVVFNGTSTVTTGATLPNTNEFYNVQITNDNYANITGGDFIVSNSLNIGTIYTNNPTTTFDPSFDGTDAVLNLNSQSFDIADHTNNGEIWLIGDNASMDIDKSTNPISLSGVSAANSGVDRTSGRVVYIGGGAYNVAANNDLAEFWNVEFRGSGTYTLSGTLSAIAVGGTAGYNNEGLFVNDGTFNAVSESIIVYEAFSVNTGGSAVFTDTNSELEYRGTNASYFNGNLNLSRMRIQDVSQFDGSQFGADAVGGKLLYFQAGSSISFDNVVTLFGDSTTNPANIGLNATVNVGSFIGMLSTDHEGVQFDFNKLASGSVNMNFLCVWDSDASSSPIVLPVVNPTPPPIPATFITAIFTYQPNCDGWLAENLIIENYTVDRDGNGKIDAIQGFVVAELQIPGTLPIDGEFNQFSVEVDGYTVTGYSFDAPLYVDPMDLGADRTTFYINIKEKPYLDTGVQPTWRILSNNSLVDSATGNRLVGINGGISVIPDDYAQPVIGYTLANPFLSEIYLHFSEEVRISPADLPLDVGDFGSTGLTPAITNVTPLNGTLTEARNYRITLGGAIPVAEMLDPAVTLNLQNIGFIMDSQGGATVTGAPGEIAPLLDNSILTTRSTHRLTDLALGPLSDAVMQPLWARDQTNTSGNRGAGVIDTFDGSAHLKAENLTLQIHAMTGVTPGMTGTVELHYQQLAGPSFENGNGLWMADVGLSGVPLLTGVDAENGNPATMTYAFSGLVPYGYPLKYIVPGTNNVQNNQLWDFSIPGVTLTNGLDLKFLLYMPDLHLYAGYLPDETSATWYDQVRPWTIMMKDFVDQGGGVSVLNNVFNPGQGEEVSLYYELASSGMVSVQVFDLAGNMVEILQRGRQEAGDYTVSWNGRNRANNLVARGVYFIRVVAPGMDEMRDVMVIK